MASPLVRYPKLNTQKLWVMASNVMVMTPAMLNMYCNLIGQS